MPYKMTKRGEIDNAVTNQFMCDTPEDLAAIPTSDITLGSVAVVIDPFEMFIAKSNGSWVSLTPTNEEAEE